MSMEVCVRVCVRLFVRHYNPRLGALVGVSSTTRRAGERRQRQWGDRLQKQTELKLGVDSKNIHLQSERSADKKQLKSGSQLS